MSLLRKGGGGTLCIKKDNDNISKEAILFQIKL